MSFHICTKTDPDALDFAPPLLRLQNHPPNPVGRAVMITLLVLLTALLIWALVGKLDIVAVAQGKLVPQSYLKIVQPADSGIVKEILVKEGDEVKEGQILMRMDTLITDADAKSLHDEYQRKRLALRRIDAELADKPFFTEAGDPPDVARKAEAQYSANRSALDTALAEERSRLEKAKFDLASAGQVKVKLEEVLPHYRTQDNAFESLAKDGYVGTIAASDKKRERIEKEEELKTQEYLIKSTRSSIVQSEKKLAQIVSDYRRQLYVERNETQSTVDKLTQEIAKQTHKQALLELRAPKDAIVKDLATHSAGTVVQPGTVLLTLVPKEDTLRAEVWVSNEDIGFIRKGQEAKLKLAAFPFQKYGMVDGEVEYVAADAADGNSATNNEPLPNDKSSKTQPLVYKALVALRATHLEMDGRRFGLEPGMQVSAEILLGRRTVMEYLLSPVQKAFHEAGRER